MMTYKFIRAKEAQATTGLPRSTFYHYIAEGLLPPPVRLGLRSVAWPASEIEAVNRARIAGKSEDEIRELVRDQIAARAALAAGGAA
jgi:prophage regulatory protein